MFILLICQGQRIITKKIINSTLFAEEQSYYVLNAQKYMADLESRGKSISLLLTLLL